MVVEVMFIRLGRSSKYQAPARNPTRRLAMKPEMKALLWLDTVSTDNLSLDGKWNIERCGSRYYSQVIF